MSSRHTFNVAVTGNAPFLEFDYNTSRMVRDALPDVIESKDNKEIRILKYYRDTRDTYDDVRLVSKDIWGGTSSVFSPHLGLSEQEDHVDVDLILHLGMIALGWPADQFRFETVARRDGYELAGDDGKFVDSDALKSLGLPPVLATSLDVKSAWRKVRQAYPDIASCVSADAGRYFCEFRMYSSLAEPLLTKDMAEKEGRTVFLHLPQAHGAEAIALASDVAVTFITGLVDGLVCNDNT